MRVGGVVHPIAGPPRSRRWPVFFLLSLPPATSHLVAVGDLISSDNRATAQVFGFTSRRRFMRKKRKREIFHQVGYSPVTSPVGTL